MKKLMILGGSRYAIPVIKSAHELGIKVITCDYLPDNIAHKYSDEYCNVSVIDKDMVLEIAQEKMIDGIISFACDPGVVSAAYVAEKMGLPFQGSYEAVSILQDKGLFRNFLQENGFNCPKAKRYISKEEAIKDAVEFKWPVIVKPTDSAGSKGVTKVENIEALGIAIEEAKKYSHNKAFIIEEFLSFKGYHSSTDVFTINGEIKFITFSDQLFDSNALNPYTPSLIIWPTTMERKNQIYLSKEIQRLMNLLGMRTGIYNIETCVATDDKPYIMEVSPRGGGCKIAELQKYAFGVDLIEEEVRSAVGMPLFDIKHSNCDGCWCEMVIHADNDSEGVFDRLIIDDRIKDKYIKELDISINKGDIVYPFSGANASIGDVFFRFENRGELEEVMGNITEYIKIVTE